MKKIFLIKNPELFQGEKKIKKLEDYFEGWYFKYNNDNHGISFIPGISITNQEKKAFIQIITNNSSYYVNYDIEDFKFSHSPFYIKIGNNFFSKEKIHIEINDNSQNLIIYGDINYSNSTNIATNIMGPFAYIPFMECNHAVISMKNTVNGIITFNNQSIIFNNDIGYIEKDWGSSFPKSYIWCQGNNFQNKNVSFMLSIADIPFKILNFRGIICSLIIDNKEYRFATYNGTKIIKCEIENNFLNIILKKGQYYLDINTTYDNTHKLLAPIKGNMIKNIFESISTSITLTLRKKDKIILSDTSTNCGLEIVNN